MASDADAKLVSELNECRRAAYTNHHAWRSKFSAEHEKTKKAQAELAKVRAEFAKVRAEFAKCQRTANENHAQWKAKLAFERTQITKVRADFATKIAGLEKQILDQKLTIADNETSLYRVRKISEDRKIALQETSSQELADLRMEVSSKTTMISILQDELVRLQHTATMSIGVQTDSMVSGGPLCLIRGCDKPGNASEFCDSHEPRKLKKRCAVNGCLGYDLGSHRCMAHRDSEICRVCGRLAVDRGLCETHIQLILCSVEGCEEERVEKTFCARHRVMVRRCKPGCRNEPMPGSAFCETHSAICETQGCVNTVERDGLCWFCLEN
jgi:hypothetical protein